MSRYLKLASFLNRGFTNLFCLTAVFLTDMPTSAKDDGDAFPVNEEDKDEHKIPEGGKNEPVESIALAISDKPSLLLKQKQILPSLTSQSLKL